MSNNQNIQTSGAYRKPQPQSNPWSKPSAMEIFYLHMQKKAAPKTKRQRRKK